MWVCPSPVECQCLVCGVGVCSECRHLLNFCIFLPLSTSVYVGLTRGGGVVVSQGGGGCVPNLSAYKNPVKIQVQGGGGG